MYSVRNLSEELNLIADELSKGRLLIYVGDGCPSFAESYQRAGCRLLKPVTLYCALQMMIMLQYIFHQELQVFQRLFYINIKVLCRLHRWSRCIIRHDRNDTFLCIPPLYHTGAKMHWMGSLVAGSKAVFLKGTKPETDIKSQCQVKHCTLVWLLVPWAQDILDALDRGDLKLEDYELSQWRLMHIGAQPVPPSLIKRWKEYFPHHQYDTNYGLSESTGPGCVHLGVENIQKVGAIGIPGYRWKCKIVAEDGMEVAQGEVGELCVKGPGVMDMLLQITKRQQRKFLKTAGYIQAIWQCRTMTVFISL